MTGFPDFWEIMKRCRGRYSNSRKVAETAWDKRVKAGAVTSDMILGARGFMVHNEEENIEPQFVCAAAVFLNKELDEQYVEVAREIEEERALALEKRKKDEYQLGRFHGLNSMTLLEQRQWETDEIYACYVRGYEETAPLTPRLAVVK